MNSTLSQTAVEAVKWRYAGSRDLGRRLHPSPSDSGFPLMGIWPHAATYPRCSDFSPAFQSRHHLDFAIHSQGFVVVVLFCFALLFCFLSLFPYLRISQLVSCSSENTHCFNFFLWWKLPWRLWFFSTFLDARKLRQHIQMTWTIKPGLLSWAFGDMPIVLLFHTCVSHKQWK